MEKSKLYRFSSDIGFATLLFSFSEHHKKYSCEDIQKYVVTPYSLNQCKLYFNEKGDAVGIVTWAWLSDYSLDRITKESFYELHLSEWNEGLNLYIMDVVAPFGDFKFIASDLLKRFHNQKVCFSVRRSDDVSIRKVVKWKRDRLEKMFV